jgi:hypothetical protein
MNASVLQDSQARIVTLTSTNANRILAKTMAPVSTAMPFILASVWPVSLDSVARSTLTNASHHLVSTTDSARTESISTNASN